MRFDTKTPNRLLVGTIAALAIVAAPNQFNILELTGQWTEAVAAKGGNGGDRGNSGDNGKSGDRNNSGDTGRGSTASDLGALNAAHASDQARDKASANSRVGKIAEFERNLEADRLADQVCIMLLATALRLPV